MTGNSGGRSTYRDQIAASIAPVRPLAGPWRRAWMLVPPGILLAAAAPVLNGQRGDLDAAPLLTWGLTAAQTLAGLSLLALGLREAVPGRNLTRRGLALAGTFTVLLILGATLLTNAASATTVRAGREWQYWRECVVGPLGIGLPFMILATAMAARAFPTRPAVAGALCGMSAGILSDAGWRLSCWISEPTHVIGSHALAILVLAVAGSLVAVGADRSRWQRFRSDRVRDTTTTSRGVGP